MRTRRSVKRVFVLLLVALLVLSQGATLLVQAQGPGDGQIVLPIIGGPGGAGLEQGEGPDDVAAKPDPQDKPKKDRITPAERKAAAERAAAAGFELEELGEATMAMPGMVPRYFSHPNYANSPLRMPDAQVTLVGDGTGAEAAATVDLGTGAITSIEVINGGSGYTVAPEVVITSTGGMETQAVATAEIDATGAVTAITVIDGGAGYVTPGLRKFVNGLPGLGPDAANDLGQYIPVAVPDQETYPGSDYYEIAVIQYREQMHSDLPPTTLRGYVQLSTDVVQGDQVPLRNVLSRMAPRSIRGISA